MAEVKWANKFPEVNATSTGEIYVILYLLSLFQNNKSNPSYPNVVLLN